MSFIIYGVRRIIKIPVYAVNVKMTVSLFLRTSFPIDNFCAKEKKRTGSCCQKTKVDKTSALCNDLLYSISGIFNAFKE